MTCMHSMATSPTPLLTSPAWVLFPGQAFPACLISMCCSPALTSGSGKAASLWSLSSLFCYRSAQEKVFLIFLKATQSMDAGSFLWSSSDVGLLVTEKH